MAEFGRHAAKTRLSRFVERALGKPLSGDPKPRRCDVEILR